ncbi:MAG: hypothetical protein Ct9H300mP16_16950 [Pseudomonadota bacterium]|nr:MAG: hypothetical protein Ct9H300mP16_16950 [Pseudomonadota bacterium]
MPNSTAVATRLFFLNETIGSLESLDGAIWILRVPDHKSKFIRVSQVRLRCEDDAVQSTLDTGFRK